jgi:hypothetical protein
MKTTANKHYAIDDVRCGHYGLISKKDGKCLACTREEAEGLKSVKLYDGVFSLHEYGGYMVSIPTSAELIETLLVERYGRSRVESEVRIGASRMRGDIVLDGSTIIEFDGPSHYTNARTVVGDEAKNKLCGELGFDVCRVPFWVQLDVLTAEHFGITDKFYVLSSFPHGWVSCDIFPASFCEAGFERFISEFGNLPRSVKLKVYESLVQCCSGRDEREVWSDSQKTRIDLLIT